MGLGKTVQAIAVLQQRAPLGPALVVAPTSLSSNWRAELRRFAPALHAVVYRGAARRGALEQLGPSIVLVTSYEIALRDRQQLAAHRFATHVIDEAQMLRNARAERSQAMRAIPADFRVALTGTPIENRIADLWSLFQLIAPGMLGEWPAFRALVGSPLEREHDHARAARLRTLIAPLILRRTKAEVAAELPDRTEVVQRVALSPAERTLYNTAVKRARLALKRLKAELAEHRRGEDKERDQRIKLLAELTRLRQLACHAALVVHDRRIESSKLYALFGLLDEVLPLGHRVLIFSTFTALLGLTRVALEQRGVSSFYLDGATPAAVRGALVDRFQAGEAHVFLISLKAGGTGLNLTAADYVVHLDVWWNPAAQDQASDRAHRIGQTRPVTIVKLIAENTIEDRVLELQAHKRWLASTVLTCDGEPAALDHELLEALLS
jgi:SNF2 family DNA or RNA helicase